MSGKHENAAEVKRALVFEYQKEAVQHHRCSPDDDNVMAVKC